MTKLREAREINGFERKYIAKKLGITADHLNVIERGTIALDLNKIELLAKLYNVTFEEMARIALETKKGCEKNG